MGSLSDALDIAEGEKTLDDPNGISVGEIEVAGVVRDKYGNSWQVPGDNVEDFDDLHAGDAYSAEKLPKELVETFSLLTVPINRVQEFAGKGWVAVRNEELAIPQEVLRMTGSPLDGYHQIGDAILMKLPKRLHEWRNKKKDEETKRRLAETEPTKDMIERAAKSGLHARSEIKHGVVGADPANREGVFADNDGRGSLKHG